VVLVQVFAALLGVLVIAWVGRVLARRLGQPEVIGEIVVGLLAGPVVIWIAGRAGFDVLLPADVRAVLGQLATGALVLFVAGQSHRLRVNPERIPRRATVWVAAGSFLPPLLAGAGLAGWVLLTGDQSARGAAPVAAFVLMIAVGMAVTAVPVLARILAERGLTDTTAGRLALLSAIVIDTAAWLLLSVAIGLRAGDLGGFLRSTGVLACGVLAALALRAVLRTRAVHELCARRPWIAAAGLAIVALAVGMGMQRAGLTAIFGAAVVGLAIPVERGGPWHRVVRLVTRVGLLGVPVFFVVTGITVFTASRPGAPWPLIVLATGLGMAGKLGGGYLGARLGGQPRAAALRVAALVNTRGLTELVVLQVGYSAGILTTAMFLALLVMALTTTSMTGPLLRLIDRRSGVDILGGSHA
jgi:Kef-type K+ transport system membrane component KefB